MAETDPKPEPAWMTEFTKCMTAAVNESKEEWMKRGMRGPALYQQCEETCQATCKAYNGSAVDAVDWPIAFPVKGGYVGLLGEQYVRRWKADSNPVPVFGGVTFLDGSTASSMHWGALGGSEEVLDLPPSRTHVWIVLVNTTPQDCTIDEWYAKKVHEVDPTVYQFKDQFSTVWSALVDPRDYRVDAHNTRILLNASAKRWGIPADVGKA
jgi:hypothetical protein